MASIRGYHDSFSILWNDILPLFVFIGAGWFLDSRFKIDIATYSRLTVMVVLPCFIFSSMYQYQGSGADMAVIPAAMILLLLMYLLSGVFPNFFPFPVKSGMSSRRCPPFPTPATSGQRW